MFFSAVVHNETCFFVFRIASGWRDTIFDETDEDADGTSASTVDLVDVVAKMGVVLSVDVDGSFGGNDCLDEGACGCTWGCDDLDGPVSCCCCCCCAAAACFLDCFTGVSEAVDDFVADFRAFNTFRLFGFGARPEVFRGF